jgi:hypothetical protein
MAGETVVLKALITAPPDEHGDSDWTARTWIDIGDGKKLEEALTELLDTAPDHDWQLSHEKPGSILEDST